MTYYDTPISIDDQDVSAPQMRTNFQQANTSFGIDHYAFSDVTASNGFHKKVTTPDQITDPVTVTNPVLYAKTTNNAGLIQYIRGPSNAVPSPISTLQSSSSAITLAPNATTNVLDFSGIPRAICQLYAFDSAGLTVVTRCQTTIYWNGSAFGNLINLSQSGKLNAIASGSILQLQNQSVSAMNNVYWTLQLLRMS